METARIRLITRGDDLGSNHSANLAIMEAYRSGILRNTSVMVTCAAVEEAADMLAGERGLCFGLHATMNAEWDSVRWGPVLPREKVPSLVDRDGYLFQTVEALRANRPSVDEAMLELQAQLDRARALGFDIKYVDRHMMWERAFEGLEERFERWCEREGILNSERTHRFLPRVYFSLDPVERLIATLELAEPGQYIIVGHPAYDNDEMRALGHPGYPGWVVAAEREWQRRIYTDPRIIAYCREHGVTPIRYDEAELLE